VLGTASAEALVALGFRVLGWSRTSKAVDRVECLSGTEGFTDVLQQADILVNLLPITDDTLGLIDERALALLPRGSCLINVSRAGVVDQKAMIQALDSGQLGEAFLDVFDVEPLPAEHPLWSHPRVTVTPHCAGPSDFREIGLILADSIRRFESGLPLINEVDTKAGY
jgi:glyoxylate/hydroxypyruvate reductase A